MILVIMGMIALGLFALLVIIGSDNHDPEEDEEQMEEIRRWMERR